MTISDDTASEPTIEDQSDAAAADDDLGRQQIEEVFGLTGGELSDVAWTPRGAEGAAHSFAYWYDGPPSYAAHDFADRYDVGYRTVVACYLFSAAPEMLEDDAEHWERVVSFASSGEAECPWRQADEGDQGDERPCPMCDARDDEPHGHIYLGEGWCEVVYREVVVADPA